VLRFGVRPIGFEFGMTLIIVPLVWVSIFALFQLYAINRLSPAEEFRRILEATGISMGVRLLLSVFIHDGRGTTLAGGWLAVSWDGLPILGSVHELSRLIEREGIECVFVASSAVGPDLMKRIAKELRRQNVEIRVSANLTQILSSRLSVQPVGELLAMSLKPV